MKKLLFTIQRAENIDHVNGFVAFPEALSFLNATQ